MSDNFVLALMLVLLTSPLWGTILALLMIVASLGTPP